MKQDKQDCVTALLTVQADQDVKMFLSGCCEGGCRTTIYKHGNGDFM